MSNLSLAALLSVCEADEDEGVKEEIALLKMYR
jgi:hypothetical protein